MPEYVYALHDFAPENEDEVAFNAGERIEVVEKDDLYGDGWWKGRNLAGKVGLFPQSYTTSAPPPGPVAQSTSTSSTATEVPIGDNNIGHPHLQVLQEEEESETLLNTNTTTNIVAPVPQYIPPALVIDEENEDKELSSAEPSPEQDSSTHKHERTMSSGHEVMKATMTDVQKAIEQLGRSHAAGDESRSFSFASFTGDNTEGETDTDYDMSDIDASSPNSAGESWHKGARTKLAEKARRAVEEAEKLEALMNSAPGRTTAPPIDVELSDESDGEEEYTSHSGIFTRAHPHIPEEEEEEEEKSTAKDSESMMTGTTGTHSKVPSDQHEDVEPRTAKAAQSSFPVSVFQPPPPSSPAPQSQTQQESKRSSGYNEGYRESFIELPSSMPSTPGEQSRHNSVASAPSLTTSASAFSHPPHTSSTLVEDHHENGVGNGLKDVKEKEGAERVKEKKHPTEWDVAEVVEWLKGRGFDQDVCEKFTEQEITGDVLLELDVNLLKSELGIMAFGKRMRIANAITELRRPPSIVYSDSVPPIPGLQRSPTSVTAHSPLSPSHSHGPGQGHSRAQSQAYSNYSYPGSGSVVISPQAFHNGGSIPNTPGSVGVGQAFPYAPGQQPVLYGGFAAQGMDQEVGYAIGEPGQQMQGQQYLEPGTMAVSNSAPVMGKTNGRPANLMLSPSDGALKSTAMAVGGSIAQEEEEDRGVASESEAAPTGTMRRRLFGRSFDSASTKLDSSSRHSREGSMSISLKGSSASPTIAENGTVKSREKEKEKEKDKEKEKEKKPKKAEGSTGKSAGERLSIFGSTFTGSLGKARKPPPRYPATVEEDTGGDKPSALSLFTVPRLTSGSSRKVSDTPSSIKRPGTSPGKLSTPKAKESRDPALLRKRTSSVPAPPPNLLPNGGPIKPGQSIIEQIGEADFSGWMRKKGDRYNSWKLRYFVLKGPDLYCLRSNNPSETKIKGYVNIVGYKVTVDENVNPGRYGFRIDHDHDKTHYFSADEKSTIRDWMKAIMKATIGRDYTRPVISSCNIPTIPLMVAQAMNPAPRPPSPGSRAATQKAMRRENTNQLSTRDARVLMGLPSPEGEADERPRVTSFFANQTVPSNDEPSTPKSPIAPARPSREMRRVSNSRPLVLSSEDSALVDWANSHLPTTLQITDTTGSICSGLHLMRIAEGIKGKPSSPPVLDSAFPQSPTDDKLDGLFQLFDFLLDNDVKMGSVSINDVRQGKRDKILQLLKALKSWEDKRRAIAGSIVSTSPMSSGGFIAPMVWS